MIDLRLRWIPGLLFLVFLALPCAVEAQAPLFLVDSRTTIASVGFEFEGGRSLGEDLLRRQIASQGSSFGQRVQEVVSVLPLVDSPALDLFNPPELLRDVKRLQRFYEDSGFQGTEVAYDVSLDTLANSVDVTFRVREGEPVLLDTVVVLDEGGSPLDGQLPPDLLQAFQRLERRLQDRQGTRLGRSLRINLRDQMINWLNNQGYPFPDVRLDTLRQDSGVRVDLTAVPGTRARVRTIQVDGNSALSDQVFRREIPLEPGAWYSRAKLAEGQTELNGLDMVRLARAGPEAVQGRDSLVDLLIQVNEGKLHLLSGRLGYTTRSGISGDVSWSHRNFLGGARRLEVSTIARTGLLAPEASVSKRYGLSLLVRQPFLFHRYVEGLLRPFGEYRDEIRDRSIEGGFETSILYRRGSARTITLRYSLTNRWVLDAGPGGPIGIGEDLVDVIAGLDTLNLDRRTSSLSLTARWGRRLDLARSRPGWRVQGTAEIAGPAGLSTVQYGKLAGEVAGEFPLGKGFTVAASTGLGRLLPYGNSIPAQDESDRLEIYLRLRDATLTAGGPQDVRGWGRELLGPKIPDFRVHEASGQIRAGDYLPLGGLARWTGSLQLEAPFPFLGRPHGVHVFLDGGRVWTPDDRFLPSAEPLVPGELDDGVRFGAGVGVSFATPVGPLQLDLGYKLNPSPLDVRDPGRVAGAVEAGDPLGSVPKERIRRWHLHLSMGGIR